MHFLPRLPAVGTATQTDFDVFLQVDAVVVAHVIDGQQRTLVAGRQARNAVGGHTVVARLTDTEAHPMDTRTVGQLQRSGLSVDFNRSHRGRELGKQRCLRLHLEADPEIIDARIECLVHVEHHFTAGRTDFALQYRIRRIGRTGLSYGIGRHIGHRSIISLAAPLHALRTAIVQLDGFYLSQVDRFAQVQKDTVQLLAFAVVDAQVEQFVVLTVYQNGNIGFADEYRVGDGGYSSPCGATQGRQQQKRRDFSHDTMVLR